jgi:hypothetical protein
VSARLEFCTKGDRSRVPYRWHAGRDCIRDELGVCADSCQVLGYVSLVVGNEGTWAVTVTARLYDPLLERNGTAGVVIDMPHYAMTLCACTNARLHERGILGALDAVSNRAAPGSATRSSACAIPTVAAPGPLRTDDRLTSPSCKGRVR